MDELVAGAGVDAGSVLGIEPDPERYGFFALAFRASIRALAAANFSATEFVMVGGGGRDDGPTAVEVEDATGLAGAAAGAGEGEDVDEACLASRAAFVAAIRARMEARSSAGAEAVGVGASVRALLGSGPPSSPALRDMLTLLDGVEVGLTGTQCLNIDFH